MRGVPTSRTVASAPRRFDRTRLVWIGWVLLLIGCSSPRDLDLQQLANGSFDTIAEEYRRSFLFFHPGLASRQGWEGYDDRVAARSEEAVATHLARLDELLLRMRRLPRSFLDEQRWVEWHWLEGQIRADLLELQFERRPERDPDFYLAPQIEGLVALLERPGDALHPHRLLALILRLQGLPEQLEAGKRQLVDPETWHCRAARSRSRAFALDLGERVGKLLDRLAERPGEKQIHDRLARSRHEALAALEAFAEFLDRDALPRAQPRIAIGTKRLRQLLAYELLVEVPLDALLDQASREAIAIRQGLTERFGEELRFESWPQLTGWDPSGSNVEEMIDRAQAEAEQLGRALEEMLPGIDDSPVVLRDAKDWEEALELRGELSGRERPEWTRAAWQRPNANMIGWGPGDWTLELLREGSRGRLLVLNAIRLHEDPLRRARPSRAVLDGWGPFVVRLLAERPESPITGPLRIAWQRRQLLVATRLIVAIRLHSETMSLTEARDFFQRRALVGEKHAQVEVDRILRDPLSATTFIVERQLLGLHRDSLRNRGLDFRPAEFARELFEQGSLPIACLRRLMLPGDVGRQRD